MNRRRKLKYVQIETTRHGTVAVYFRRNRRARIRLPNDMESVEFKECYQAALDDRPLPVAKRLLDVRDMKPTAIELRKQRSEKKMKSALHAAKVRAKRKGLAFDLDRDFLLSMLDDQGHRCALTGIEFFAKIDNTSRIDPCTPSIDRIVPSRGYVKGNVRLVLYAMNAMLNDWGEGVFIKIANSYRYTNRTKK